MNPKSLLIVGIAAICVTPALSAQTEQTDSLSVAVGTVLGNYINETLQHSQAMGMEINTDVFVRTVDAVLHGKSTGMSVQEADNIIENYLQNTRKNNFRLSDESQQEFLDSVAALPGAVTLPDGLIFFVDVEGEGPLPENKDIVTVMYVGRLADGTVFDVSESPVDFQVDQLVPGFSEGLKMMRPGGRYRIVMPASMAYSDEGAGGVIPGNAALDFSVELIGIKK